MQGIIIPERLFVEAHYYVLLSLRRCHADAGQIAQTAAQKLSAELMLISAAGDLVGIIIACCKYSGHRPVTSSIKNRDKVSASIIVSNEILGKQGY